MSEQTIDTSQPRAKWTDKKMSGCVHHEDGRLIANFQHWPVFQAVRLANQVTREHNSHDALLAACKAAVEALYYATRCGAQSRDEQEAVNSCRVQLEAAIAEAE